MRRFLYGVVGLVGLASAALFAGAAPARAAVSAPVLKWAYGGCFSSWCQTGWYSSPAVADLDGDGQPEVIWGSYDVVALNGANGSLKWRGPNGNRVWPGVAIADLTGSGAPQVIVGRSGDQVTVYDRFGNVVWTRNPFGFGEVRTLTVADLESDGRLEIVAGRAGNGDTLQLNVFEPDSSVRPGWPARHNGEPGYGWGMYNENVAVADMNGDGFKEVFGPTDTHYITALDRNGNQLPANGRYTGRQFWSEVGVHVDDAVDVRGYAICGTEHRPNFADSAPVVTDVDGDGVPELIVIGNVYNCGTNPYTDLYHMPFIFKLDRTRWSGSGFNWTAIPPDRGPTSRPRSEDYNIIENAVPNPVVADLDGDGLKEIIFPSYDGKVHAYWLDKTEHGSWPYTIPTTGGADDFRFASEPVVADLDNDGHAEVIFTSWPKKATGAVGHLHILNYLGQELYRIPLPAARGGGYNGGLGAPTLANIDSDPDLEVVVGTIGSGVVAYGLPNTAYARVLWGTGRGGYRRTGAVTQVNVSVGDASVVEGNAGSTNAVFTVSLSAPSGDVVKVSYATADGTALAGNDYAAAVGTLTFPPGTTTQTVSVPVLGDRIDEPDETFFVNLSSPVNAVIVDGQGVGTVVNDDSLGLSIDDVTVVEGQTAVFTVTLSPPSPTLTVTVNYATAGNTATSGTDFVGTSGTLTFPPNTTTRTISVVTNKDSLVEGAETFFVTLTTPVNAAIAYSQGTGKILDPQGGADFNGDGKTDVLWQNQASGLLVAWYMDGVTRTNFTLTNPGQVTDLTWKIVGTADLNADGKPDILWQNQSSGLLVVWYMDGVTRTSFAALNPGQVSDLNWKIVATGDFNSDGKPDILWHNQASGLLVVWYMDEVTRTGFDVLNPSQVADLNWKVVATGDFNGDGKADVLWRHQASGLLVVWYMNGVTRTGFATLDPGQVTDLNWKIYAAADFNADGKPDILWQHQGDGLLVVWYMDGVTRTSFAALNPSQVTDPNWRIVAPK